MHQSIDLSKEAIAAIERGKLIEAIKITRATTGLGLKESKDVVDAYVNANPAIQEKLRVQQTNSGVSREMVLFIVIAAALFFTYVKFFKA